MANVVPVDIPFPDLPPTKFIATLDGVVLFSNFAVDSAKPVTPFHTDFIRLRLVPFLIKQIDELGFADRFATLHLFGFASATGTAAHNQVLSQARAQAIGDAIAAEFEKQKDKSKLAHNIQIKIDPHGEGDEVGRLQLAAIQKVLGRRPSSAEIEQAEFALRSVRMRIQAVHRVVDDDTKVLGREVFSVKFKKERRPANLLEQTIQEIEDESPAILRTLLGVTLDGVKELFKEGLKDFLKDAEIEQPELFFIFEMVEFVIPGDLILGFEFKDSRGRLALYKYTGVENKDSIGILKVLSKILSVLKWMAKFESLLKKNEKLLKSAGKFFQNTDVFLKLFTFTVKQLEKRLSDLTAKGSVLRRTLGDGVADIIEAILELGSKNAIVVAASDFVPVIFDRPSVFDVTTFNGPARTETREFLGAATLRLDFLGQGPEGLLGFRATMTVTSRFSIFSGLIGFGVSKGFLLHQPLKG
jgi:hypothetical protein